MASPIVTRSGKFSIGSLIQKVVDFTDKGFGRERFLQESGAGFRNTVMADDIVRVPGDVEDFDVGTNSLNDLRQLPSAHLRHDDISDQRVDGTGMLTRNSQSHIARSRFEHPISLAA